MPSVLSAADLEDFHRRREQSFLSKEDLFGKLVELGISPPQPTAKRMTAKTKRRVLHYCGGILGGLVALGLLIRGVVSRDGQPVAKGEPDSVKAYQDAVQSGDIRVYASEAAVEMIERIRKETNAKKEERERKTAHMSERFQLRNRVQEAENQLRNAANTALANASSLYRDCNFRSDLAKNISDFRDKLSSFRTSLTFASQNRVMKLSTLETKEEFESLLREIDEQKAAFRQLLDSIPEIALKDENIKAGAEERVEQARSALLKVRDSLDISPTTNGNANRD